jgi:FkbM family methyltransferase
MIQECFRTLWHFSQRYREPYKTLWSLKYVLERKTSAFPGVIQLGRWRAEYLDPYSLAAMWEVQFFKRYNDFYTTNQAPYVLDCGANVGVSVFRYKQLFPNCRITAFEPDPRIYEVLVRNISRNALRDVDAVQAAVWSENSKMEFLSFRNNDSQSGSINIDDGDEKKVFKERIEVDTVWLGGYLQTHVDFLKLDIEGAEFRVLESCKHLLHNVEQLIVEVHHKVQEPQALINIMTILKDAGFNIAVYQYYSNPRTYVPFVRNPSAVGDQFPVLWGWRD